ncbi:MAG: hypothetical protein RXR43_10380 [Sulfolobus sp.]
MEEQPQVIDQMLNVIKTISVKELGGRKRVKISIDWTSIGYKGKPVEGLGGLRKRLRVELRNHKSKEKTLILAFTCVE